MENDLFISHASEDKEVFARPLAVALAEKGLQVWYDEFSLNPGDSLRQSIDDGLATSKYAILILSHNFFSKNWTNWELNGLIQRHLDADYPLLIPIWHEVATNDIRAYSPPLADIVAIQSSEGIPDVASRIHRTISNNHYKYSEAPVLANGLNNTISAASIRRFNGVLERVSRMCSEIFSLEVHRASLLVPVKLEKELALKPIATWSFDYQKDIQLIPAKSTIAGLALTQNSFVAMDTTNWDECWVDFESKDRYLKSTIAMPIKLHRDGQAQEVTAVLVFDSSEVMQLSNGNMVQLQEIVDLVFTPLVELFVASGDIVLTKQ